LSFLGSYDHLPLHSFPTRRSSDLTRASRQSSRSLSSSSVSRRLSMNSWISRCARRRLAAMSSILRLQSLDLVVDAEPGLLQILDLRVRVLVPRSGEVLDCVSSAVVSPLLGNAVNDLDLAPAVVAGVVDRLVLD